MSYTKLVVYVPTSHTEQIRQVLSELGCGKLGKYDSCSFTIKGTGRFRPQENAKPFIGKKGQLEEVPEERIETLLETAKLEEVIRAVRKVHPYEEPAIEAYPLLYP